MTVTFPTKKAAQAARNQLCAMLKITPETCPVASVNIVTCGRPAVTRWTIHAVAETIATHTKESTNGQNDGPLSAEGQ